MPDPSKMLAICRSKGQHVAVELSQFFWLVGGGFAKSSAAPKLFLGWRLVAISAASRYTNDSIKHRLLRIPVVPLYNGLLQIAFAQCCCRLNFVKCNESLYQNFKCVMFTIVGVVLDITMNIHCVFVTRCGHLCMWLFQRFSREDCAVHRSADAKELVWLL